MKIENNKKRACIFAHFDKHNKVDEYIFYYLQELLHVSEKIIFVTVVDISLDNINKLELLGINVIKRENIGYDFYSYKTGIDILDLTQFDELILCNDSVYGPIIPMKSIFKKMENINCDFFGITASHEVSYHLQSYFTVYRKPILDSTDFLNFWKKIIVLDSKLEIIKKYEIGLSSLLLASNFTANTYIENISDTLSSQFVFMSYLKRLVKNPLKIYRLFIFSYRYISSIRKQNINIAVAYWDKLLEHNMPFIKVSLFTTDDERKENIQKLEKILQNFSEYPIGLIKNHLERVNLDK